MGGIGDMVFSTVFYDLVNEEIWNIVKKNKNPVIDFKALNRYAIAKIKILKPEIFEGEIT